jgi:hypothetical protein
MADSLSLVEPGEASAFKLLVWLQLTFQKHKCSKSRNLKEELLSESGKFWKNNAGDNFINFFTD